MKVSIIGSGYVGSVSAACFAELGHEVICIDIDEEKVKLINSGRAPIWEEGLDGLLEKHSQKTLIATSDYDYAVQNSDASFICVGTPSGEDGSIDLSIVKAASESLGRAIAKKEHYHVVVVKSTVVPETTEKVVLSTVEEYSGKKAGRDFGVAMNPEFLREGKAVYDFMHPDKIVVGAIDERSGFVVSELYRGVDCPVTHTDPRTAEMIKYVNNSFLATKISFANEIGNICKQLGIDTYEVMDAVGTDFRVERSFLNCGAGFGGSCFPKDVKALIGKANGIGYRPHLLESVVGVNDRQPLKMVELLQDRLGELGNRRIAVLGLAFKNDTDDIRESRSIPVIAELLRQGADIAAYDPMAAENMKKVFPDITYCKTSSEALEEAEGCLIMTEWDEFGKLDKEFGAMAGKTVIDGRKMIDPKKLSTDIDYEGICW
ncbi:UDP-glucose dehydrogenase family protein [Methanolobus halotolerans]|uniref:UDP-glucose 6-dehydrogenase n=1 Tax=Methanolobus halotolerans TaxID=2052935 RepID=A0A4E0Q3L9_9EURY|nr:UDP-glucose/GDP-mannose dehydrogenase family protein [Methanolobus halotolerans]TGC08142.1 UDP-glucose 6-dehydrogenase [Methanolobus halotolerans]